MNNLKYSNFDAARADSYRFVVMPEHAGTRLDKLLSDQPAITSREMARRLIDEGAARLNGKKQSPATRVRADDVVQYHIPPPMPSPLMPESGPLNILYEDDAVAVIDKPPGIAVHPGPGPGRGGTLVNLLLHHCRDLSGVGGVLRPGIVHRLDKDTTGVMVVAKNDAAHLHLSEQFKAHSIGRSYLAIVVGQPAPDRGKVDLPLGRHGKHRMKRMVRPDGKPAITHWQVEKRIPPFALLRIQLATGRTHQIRVHMNEQGWPVACDPLYGEGRHRGLALPAPLQARLQKFGRQALHAAELVFVHPVTGESVAFQSPLPADMAKLLHMIENHLPA